MKTQLLLAICCISLAASSQNFRRTYGWGAYNTAPAFTQSPAGGFALLGSFSSPTSYQTDFVLMRTDTAGVFQWAKAYGGSGVDEARDLLQLPDSGWLLVGFTNSFSPNNDYNGYVIRLTANGDTVWTRQIGSSSWDFLYDVEWAPNGNFLLSGATNNSPNGKTAGWLVEVSPAGTIIHQYFYENSGNVFFQRSDIASNGDIFSAGYTEDPISLTKKGLVVKFDALTQDTAWSFSFTSTDEDVLNDIKLLPNGNIAICGVRQLNSTTNNDNLVAVLLANGTLSWQESVNLPGASSYQKILLLGDTLLAGGFTSDFGEGGKDMVVNWFSAGGTFIKGNTLGYTQDEILFDLELTSDRQLLLGGTTTSYGPGLQSMLFVRTDTAFSLGTNLVIGLEENNDREKIFSVYPNPAQDRITIQHLPKNKKVDYSIFNTAGKRVYFGSIESEDFMLPVGELPNGLYFLQFYLEGNIVSPTRIIVQR